MCRGVLQQQRRGLSASARALALPAVHERTCTARVSTRCYASQSEIVTPVTHNVIISDLGLGKTVSTSREGYRGNVYIEVLTLFV